MAAAGTCLMDTLSCPANPDISDLGGNLGAGNWRHTVFAPNCPARFCHPLAGLSPCRQWPPSKTMNLPRGIASCTAEPPQVVKPPGRGGCRALGAVGGQVERFHM